MLECVACSIVPPVSGEPPQTSLRLFARIKLTNKIVMKSTINCQFKYERRPLRCLSALGCNLRLGLTPTPTPTTASLHCCAMDILKQQPQVACALQQQQLLQLRPTLRMHCTVSFTLHLPLPPWVACALLSRASPSGCRECIHCTAHSAQLAHSTDRFCPKRIQLAALQNAFAIKSQNVPPNASNN